MRMRSRMRSSRRKGFKRTRVPSVLALIRRPVAARLIEGWRILGIEEGR